MRLNALSVAASCSVALVCLATASAQQVSLHARTASDLAELCGANPRAPTGPAQLNYCDGFAQGAVDVEFRHAGATKPFCITPGTKREVTLHEFSSWVRANPSRGSDEATVG